MVEFYLSPLVEGSMVYFGSGGSTFYAINKDTGLKKWAFNTGGAINSSPFIGGSMIYFASADGNFYTIKIK